jgi:hypothetical protein
MAGPGRLASILILAAALLSPAVLADATAPNAVSLPATPVVLDLKAIGWQSLEYSRSNAWASVSSRIVLHEVPAAALERRPLIDAAAVAGEALTPAGGRLLLLQAENQAASNRERLSSWFDPAANTLLQRCRVAYGRSDSRAQCYLYGDGAVWRERRERGGNGGPDEPEWVQGGAKTAAVPDWPVSSRVELARPAAIPADAGLTSPMLLLPLASAAPLEQTGDSQTVFVHTDLDFYRVTLRLQGRETIDVEYRLTTADGTIRKVAGQARSLVVALETHAVGAARDEFTLLGMSGPLQLLLDPATRVPLAIRGNAPWIGQTELRLDGASLVE